MYYISIFFKLGKKLQIFYEVKGNIKLDYIEIFAFVFFAFVNLAVKRSFFFFTENLDVMGLDFSITTIM